MLWLHHSQYATRVERLALKPANAPHPDAKMQLSLLHVSEKGTSPVLDQLHLDAGRSQSLSGQHLRQSRLDELRHRPDPKHSGLPAAQGAPTLT